MSAIWIVVMTVQIVQVLHIYQIYALRRDIIDLQRGKA